MMVSLVLVPLGCLIHHYFRRKILPGTAERSAAGSRQSAVDPGGSVVDELRTQNPAISIPLAELLSVLD